MPNFGVFPLGSTLLATTTATTTNGSTNTGSTGALTIGLASAYRFAVEVSTASGTITNLNVGIYSSCDGGTVYDLVAWTTALTTAGGQQLLFRPFLNAGDAATTITNYILGTNTAATNAAIVSNGPIDSTHIKVAWQLAGTNTASISFAVKY